MKAVRTQLSQLGRRLDFPAIARLMTAALERPGLLSLAAGFTDNATLPLAEVGDLAAELARAGDASVLQYGANQGRTALRAWTAERLDALDGVPRGRLNEAQAFITNGSQQALHLAASILCDPGDIVLVEQPTYFVFLEALKGLGIRPVGIPALSDGAPDLDGFRSLLAGLIAEGQAARVRALYLVSYHSNPSSRSLSEAEKTGLAEALRAAGLVVPVIEDAAYRELGYDGPSDARSVFSLPAYDGFPRLFLGTFTKTYATGLKVGYGLCDDPLWLGQMLYLKGHQDFGTGQYAQALIERAVLTGRFEAGLVRLRAAYARKAGVLDGLLRRSGLEAAGWSWSRPDGGLYLWLRGPEGLDTGFDGPLFRAAMEAGVLYVPGELCFPPGADNRHVRLSFGVLDGDALEEAGRRFVQACEATRG